MTAELTVPETIALLHQRGHTEGYSIWSDRYSLPLRRIDTGWQVTDTGYGWLLYRSEGGNAVTPYRCFTSESQLCAALLEAVLGPAPAAPHPVPDPAFDTLLAHWRHTPWRYRPASRAELAEALARHGVPGYAYSLHGGAFPGRLCLEERTEGWRVHQAELSTGWLTEAAACTEFWRKLVTEHLPTLLGTGPRPLPTPVEPLAAEDDLTLPEALAILRRNGLPPSIAVFSVTHGVHEPGPRTDDVASLHEVKRGRWELRYTERGRTEVRASYAREGDAAADLIAPHLSVPGIASPDRHADRFATGRYEQLLHHWRQSPWQAMPGSLPELAIALRDFGFPHDSYRLTGGRGSDGLCLAERLDSWRVYWVRGGRVFGETRHESAGQACWEFWRRAVDQLLPELFTR